MGRFNRLGGASINEERRLGHNSWLKCKSRGKKWITGRRNTHTPGQGRCRAAGIVIVIVVARLFAGDLSITLCEFDQEASGG
jgi:hypothetical protein